MKHQCIRCGRPLKDPESIRRGYGPECFAAKVDWEQNRIDFESDFDEESQVVLSAMETRTLLVHSIPCPSCGYKCLNPISWTESSCTICKARHNKHIFTL